MVSNSSVRSASIVPMSMRTSPADLFGFLVGVRSRLCWCSCCRCCDWIWSCCSCCCCWCSWSCCCCNCCRCCCCSAAMGDEVSCGGGATADDRCGYPSPWSCWCWGGVGGRWSGVGGVGKPRCGVTWLGGAWLRGVPGNGSESSSTSLFSSYI